MKELIAITVLLILGIIVIAHVYWAFGGKLWLDRVAPKLEGSEADVFTPGMLATLAVAVVLCLFGLSVMQVMTWVDLSVWFVYGAWATATIFLLRAVGEFKYVGFFKRVKDSDFAKLDTLFYSPLCLFLSISIFSLFF
ncbi:MAG: DUF3995 domain-containing protein [Aureispira sp.]|nr:DUF3995 domain-containing protein [Aureispira sp.]